MFQKNIVSALFAVALVSGCASTESTDSAAAAPARIETVQVGDSDLSCQALSSQIADMDRITTPPAPVDASGKVLATGAGVAATNGAVQAVAATGAVSAVPFVGGFISMGMGLANASKAKEQAAQQQQAAAQRMQAMQRKQYLVQIFASKKC
jgi:hypothetical protein